MYKLLIAALVAVPAVPAVPASAASFGQDAAKPSEQALDQQVCKRDTAIGSRVQKRRICMTRREWVRLENGTREDMGEFLKRSTAGAPRS